VRRRAQGEDGTVLMLVIGFTFLLLVMVGVVVDVSAVVLAKRAVVGAADGAAVSAAQSLDLDRLYREGLGEQIPLDPAVARARVGEYERRVGADQPGLSLVVRVDGRTAVVTAARTLRLPFPVPGSSGTVQIESVARARAPAAP
jgi:hypothetical protein